MRARQALPCRSFVAAILIMGGCGGGAPTSPALVSSPVAFESQASANFVFRFTPMDAGTVAATAAAVEAHHARIVADLGVPGMPPVRVTLYPDVDALRAAV